MNHSYLQRIRESELQTVIPLFPPCGRVLEIGAGAGWQAKALAEKGYRVEAIDVDTSQYSSLRVWPVKMYDGRKIPYPARAFDVIFSSSVLEHLQDIEFSLSEMNRVLKPEGIAVHVVPSACWRFWTILAHYPFVLKCAIGLSRRKERRHQTAAFAHANDQARRRRTVGQDIVTKASVFAFPASHGNRGNFLTQLYYFSGGQWVHLFRRAGWRIVRHLPNHLFYTGYAVLGPALPMGLRSALSHVLGSSCHIYVLQPPPL